RSIEHGPSRLIWHVGQPRLRTTFECGGSNAFSHAFPAGVYYQWRCYATDRRGRWPDSVAYPWAHHLKSIPLLRAREDRVSFTSRYLLANEPVFTFNESKHDIVAEIGVDIAY